MVPVFRGVTNRPVRANLGLLGVGFLLGNLRKIWRGHPPFRGAAYRVTVKLDPPHSITKIKTWLKWGVPLGSASAGESADVEETGPPGLDHIAMGPLYATKLRKILKLRLYG